MAGNSRKVSTVKARQKRNPIYVPNPALERRGDSTAAAETKFFVVGIGASAGGLEAIEQFFEHMDTDSGLAFVIVQHLSPDYKSLMVELLSKHTRMKVESVRDNMAVEANCIYLIPPRKNMTIFQGKLLLEDQDRKGLNLPIDIFFRSLAEDMGERAIGVVLSGTGSDGTLGVRAIKGAGGMVMVQDETSAKFDGMPKSAVSTGIVDFVLSPQKMGQQLLRYVKHPLLALEKGSAVESQEDDSLAKILSTLRLRTGVDFTFYKPTTIIRRIERRMSVNSVTTVSQYVELLNSSPSEVSTLNSELLIGVTAFFRDPESFAVIREQVIPRLCRVATREQPIRIWVAGCSTGEEAYTLAILFQEYIDQQRLQIEVKIFATDIDKQSLERASTGLYPETIMVDVKEEQLHKYFRKTGNHFQVVESIRKMVVFAHHNVIKDPPFSKIDLVTCRNLLIYLQPVMQQRVLTSFRFSLNPAGVMFLGSSESIGELSSYFTPINSRHKIYACANDSRPLSASFFSMAPRGVIDGFVRRDRLDGGVTEEEELYFRVRESAMSDHIPASMIVDSSLTLLHVFGDVNRYLRVPAGRANLNILKMVQEDVAVTLGVSLRKAFKDKTRQVLKRVSLRNGETTMYATIDIVPTVDRKTRREFALVIFEDWKKRSHRFKGEADEGTAQVPTEQLASLEQELQYSKQTLQATIEELESANEELQSTNEELIASNEELQSTNEELQSVNEELYTVNSEYQKKIEELSELNDDVNNWFGVTRIGTIFLDLKLCVRKFTSEVVPALNLIPSDIGRPMSHIVHNFRFEGLYDEVEKVASTLQQFEADLQLRDSGEWRRVRILPYRTSENAIKGVIIVITNINDAKRAELQVERERELLLKTLETSPSGRLMVNESGAITFANEEAATIVSIPRGALMGMDFRQLPFLDEHEMPFPGDGLETEIITRKRRMHPRPARLRRSDGSMLSLSIEGLPILSHDDSVTGVMYTMSIVPSRCESCGLFKVDPRSTVHH